MPGPVLDNILSFATNDNGHCLPSRNTPALRNPSATKMRSGFAFFAPWQNLGWEPQVWRPPVYLTRNGQNTLFAAVARGDDGIQGKYQKFRPRGWDPVLPDLITYPKQMNAAKKAAFMRGDDGTQQRLIWFFSRGWEPILPDLLTYPNEKMQKSALLRGDDGIQFPFSRFFSSGWQPTLPDLLTYPRDRYQRNAAALSQWEDGIEAKFVFVPPASITWGWEVQPPMLVAFPNERQQRLAASRSTSQFAVYSTWVNYGWEVQPMQPPVQLQPREKHAALSQLSGQVEARFIFVATTQNFWGYEQIWQPPQTRFDRAAAVMRGDDGTQGTFINFLPGGWQPTLPDLLTYPRDDYQKTAIMRGDDGTQFTFLRFQPYGWEVQSYQPQHPRPERAGTIMVGHPGIDAAFVFVPATPVAWGWEVIQPHLRPSASHRYYGLEGSVDFASFSFQPYGWEMLPWQPPHPRPERSGAVAAGSVVDAKFVFVPPTFFPWGYEHQMLPWTRLRRDPSWRGDDGAQFPLIQFLPSGWEVQPWQPPHPRPERAGAFMAGHPGMDAVYVFVPPTPAVQGWDVAPAISYRVRHERAGAFLRGDDGVQQQMIRFFPSGWEIQLPQPPSFPKTNVRLGALSQWEDGVEGPFTFVPPAFTTQAWEVQSWQPPFKVNRIEAMLRGDDGIQYPFVNWRNAGWEVQPWQPPHRAPEYKAGAWLRGDDGTEGVYVRWFNSGWEVQPFQPPHRAPEWRSATFSRGDDGVQQRFLRWFNMGWEVQPWQPPHPRPERFGSVAVGDMQPWDRFVFVPPPILARFDPNYLTWGPPRVQITSPSRRDFETWPPTRKTVTKPAD